MQEMDIPSDFLCPISMQLMRDPVTVSTGITYDRDHIEKWLFSCKSNSCPVTKQIITDLDLTPNHTLRRLIQSWCILNDFERIPTPKQPVDKTQILKLLNDAKKYPQNHLKFLKKLHPISQTSARNKIFLEQNGAVDFLASVIKAHASSSSSSSSSSEAIEEALNILYNLQLSDSSLKQLADSHEFLDSLAYILRSGSYQSRCYAILLLKSTITRADPGNLISIKPEVLLEVVQVLNYRISQQASKAALKILIEICPWGRNRIKAVEVGAVHVAIEILVDGASTSSSERSTNELILVVLDLLCGCAEGRAELLKHGAGLAVVAKKLLRVSHVGTARAVRIISSICKFSATSRVLQEMLQVGVVSKLCLVIQVENGGKTKERAKEILRLHSRVWRDSPCIPSNLLSSFPSL